MPNSEEYEANLRATRVRNRAYFHWENRTGRQWWDPVSNWLQAESEEGLALGDPLAFSKEHEAQDASRADSRCYAATLGDCSGQASREHYVSRSVLEIVGQVVQISGFPWQKPNEEKTVGTSVLTAKILCRHHNSLLSRLDAAAKEFVVGLKDAYDSAIKGNMSNGTCSIPGDQLERWLLKVLVGIFNLSTRYQVPKEWVEMLFERKPWPVGEGIHIFGAPGAATWNFQLLRIILVHKTGDARSILGAKFGLGGLPLLLAFGKPRFQEAGIEALFRPGKLKVSQGSSVREIQISWPDQEKHGVVTLAINGPGDDASGAPRSMVDA